MNGLQAVRNLAWWTWWLLRKPAVLAMLLVGGVLPILAPAVPQVVAYTVLKVALAVGFFIVLVRGCRALKEAREGRRRGIRSGELVARYAPEATAEQNASDALYFGSRTLRNLSEIVFISVLGLAVYFLLWLIFKTVLGWILAILCFLAGGWIWIDERKRKRKP